MGGGDASWYRLAPTGAAWLSAYRLVNLSLRAGAGVYWVLGGGKGLDRGDFLIAAGPDEAGRVRSLADRLAAPLQAAGDPAGLTLLRLGPAHVGLYGGGGAPYNHARILAEAGFDVAFVSAQAVRAGTLDDFDVFVVPGGGRSANRGQLRLLGETGARQVTRFVEEGGLYLGSCAGAHNVCVIPDAARPKYGQRLMQLINVGMWHLGAAEWHWQEFPGVGVIESRNTRPDHPVMFGLPDAFKITHYNGPVFALTAGALEGASEAVPLMRVTGYTDDFTPGEHALSFSRYRGHVPGSVIERAIEAGGINGAVGYFGAGRVVVFGSHPEFGYTLEMDNYQSPARMLANSVLWQSAHRSRGWQTQPAPAIDGLGVATCEPPGAGLSLVVPAVATVHAAAQALQARGLDPVPSWLQEAQAMSTFGLSGEVIWRRTLDGFEAVDARIAESIAHLQSFAAAAPDRLRAALSGLEAAIHYEAPAAWNQDFGYQGVLRTLDVARDLLDRAAVNFGVNLSANPDPYAHDDVNPYHLVAACYYSAFGMFLNARYLLRVHERRLEDLMLLHEAALETTQPGRRK